MGHYIAYGIGGLLIALGILFGGQLTHFYMNAALLLTAGTLTAFSVANHGASAVLAAMAAARQPHLSEDLVDHYHVLQSVRRMGIFVGLIGALVGLFIVWTSVGQPDGREAIGPGAALSFLSMLYSITISELLVGPLCSRLRSEGPIDADWSTPDDKRLFAFIIGLFITYSTIYILYALFSPGNAHLT